LRDRSEKIAQLISAEIAIAQDLGEQSRSDFFLAVDWNHGRPPIGVPQYVMAALTRRT